MTVAQPKKHEPIRFRAAKSGPRYDVTLDVGPKGGPRKQSTRTFASLDEARAYVTDAKSQMQRGVFSTPSGATLRDLATKWLEHREAETRTPGGIRRNTLAGYRNSLSGPLLHLGDRKVQDLTAADVRGLLVTLQTIGGVRGEPVAQRTVAYALGTLKQVFNYAVELGWLSTNPAQPIKPPKKQLGDRKKINLWSVDELVAFRNEVDTYADGAKFESEPWVSAAMRLTLCGLRRSEVLGLDWKTVNLKAGSVRIEQSRAKSGTSNTTYLADPKSDESARTIEVEAIHTGTRVALRTLWIAQGQPDAGLVVLDTAAQPVHPDAYSRRFRALCVEAKVRYPGSLHNIRHAIGTALHDSGVEPRKAASLLGHSLGTHIAFYLPNSDEGGAEAARAAGALFRGAKGAAL